MKEAFFFINFDSSLVDSLKNTLMKDGCVQNRNESGNNFDERIEKEQMVSILIDYGVEDRSNKHTHPTHCVDDWEK